MADDMYQKIYWDAQEALDKILGPNEEDGAGEGLVAEIYLVGAQRDEARAAIERVRALHSPSPGWEREWINPAEALANGWPRCAGCQTVATYAEIGKCPTLAALDADQPEAVSDVH